MAKLPRPSVYRVPNVLRGLAPTYGVDIDGLSYGLVGQRADGTWARGNGWGRAGTARFPTRAAAVRRQLAWELLRARRWDREHGTSPCSLARLAR
jgi:hypothetical protein